MNTNFIVVGGPIAAGKSTLIKSLPFPFVEELDYSDDLQEIMLEQTYKKNRIKLEVVEYYFLAKRKNKYIQYSNKKELHVLDRSIFESLWFAKSKLNTRSYNHFYKLWCSEIKDVLKDYGRPKMYILLTISWKTFKERLFERNRKVEIEHFQTNKKFFYDHVKFYEKNLVKVFQEFNIPFVKINTNKLNANEVLEKTNIILKKIKVV